MSQAIRDDRKTQTRRVLKRQPTRSVNDWSSDAEPGEVVIYRGAPCVLRESRGRNKRDIGELTPEKIKCPYGKPGDRLWVKEEHWRWGYWDREGKTKTGRDKYLFRPISDGLVSVEFEKPVNKGPFAKRDGSIGWVYRHARFMPRSLSRITLEIVSIRVERLQEITEADAIAEGFEAKIRSQDFDPAVAGFYELWEKLNADRGKCETCKGFGIVPAWSGSVGGGSLAQDSKDCPECHGNTTGYGWDANPWVFVVTFKRV